MKQILVNTSLINGIQILPVIQHCYMSKRNCRFIPKEMCCNFNICICTWILVLYRTHCTLVMKSGVWYTCIFQQSVVGYITCYSLDSPGFEPWSEVRFSGPIQTSPHAHPHTHLYNGYWVSFLGVKQPGHGLTSHPILVLGSSMGRAIPLAPLCACLVYYGTAFSHTHTL